MKSGIYQIVNTVNLKKYYGSSKDLEKRRAKHLHALKTHTHHNKNLRRDCMIYGPDAFRFEVIQYVNVEDLLEYEKAYINLPGDKYNIQEITNLKAADKNKIVSDKMKAKFGELFDVGEDLWITREAFSSALKGLGFSNFDIQTIKQYYASLGLEDFSKADAYQVRANRDSHKKYFLENDTKKVKKIYRGLGPKHKTAQSYNKEYKIKSQI